MDRKVIVDKLAQTIKLVRKSQPASQQDKWDKRLSELDYQAQSLEARAGYAEAEAQLRKRIAAAQARVKAALPPGVPGGLSSLGGLWGRIPTPLKILLVLLVSVVALVFLAKSCSV